MGINCSLFVKFVDLSGNITKLGSSSLLDYMISHSIGLVRADSNSVILVISSLLGSYITTEEVSVLILWEVDIIPSVGVSEFLRIVSVILE